VKQFTCYNIANARSLNNKLGDLQFFLDSNNPYIVILTETWLNRHTPHSLIACSTSFNVFRKDFLSCGGDIRMLVRKFSNINVISVNLPADQDDLDILAVDLQDPYGTLPLPLLVTYRPPGYSSIDNIRLFSALHSLADGHVRLRVVVISISLASTGIYLSIQTIIYTVLLLILYVIMV